MPQSTDIQGALHMLEQILQRQKSAGADTVAISPEALQRLQTLPMAMVKSAQPAPQPVATPAPVMVEKAPTPTPATPPPSPEPVQKTETAPPQPVANHSYGDLASGVEMRGRVEVIFPSGNTTREKLNNLYRLAKRCDVCRGMGTLRDTMVFATGNPAAALMFVGEAPGEEEEKQKKPFVGPAGQKLDGIIKAMGLSRDEVYISNIVKYRPKIGDGRFQGPKNRKPTPEEMAMSVKFVRSEIEIVKPKVIVALGGTAAEGLLEQGGSVAAMRGHSYILDGIPVIVTYHPSYLLRAENEPDKERARREKRKVWEDMLRAMETLELPISEKQRGFFS